MSWKYLRADEYCNSVCDGTHDTPRQRKNGYKLITGKCIKDGIINLSDAYYISKRDYDSINERSLVEQWDVIVSMIGTVGEAVVVKDIPDYAIKNIGLFKCGGSELKGRWLYYYFRTSEFQQKIRAILKGSSQQFLSLEQLRGLPVLCSDETTMENIIDILITYDCLIENSSKQIRLLEELLHRTYKKWFVDLQFPGYKTTKVYDGVPAGWQRKRADELFLISIGKTPPRVEKRWFSKKHGIPWASISDMGNTPMFIFNTDERLTQIAVKWHNIKIIPPGTILLSFKLTIGRVSIAARDMCTNEAIAHFSITDPIMREYVYMYLKSFEYNTLGSTSTISTALNSDLVKKMPFIMPTYQVIEKFHQNVEPVFREIESCQKRILALAEMRDRLLPKLMNGELEV